MFENLGARIIAFFVGFGEISLLCFRVFKDIFRGKIHFRNTIDQMMDIGIRSIPVVFVTAVFVGMVFAIQIVKEFLRFGASALIGGVMGLALWRELVPLLSGVVVAGRIGAAITAELGSMKVTEQIEALESMGQNPITFLVVPRVIATTLMIPLLVGAADIIGFFSGFYVAVSSGNVNPYSYFSSADSMLVLKDIYGGLIKAGLFSFVIAIIGCYMGLRAEGGAKGVGETTTASVVTSLISIFVINYFLSVVIY